MSAVDFAASMPKRHWMNSTASACGSRCGPITAALLNVQNLGGRWANDYAQGDRPACDAYHADLLCAAGFRYFWLDAYATNRFSLGTPSGRSYESTLAAPDTSPWGDQILCRDTLRSGREIVTFRRFRGKRRWAPDPGSLADQLSTENLDHLEATGGAVVLYQHLGCFREPDGRAVGGRGRLLPRPAVQQFEDLASRYHSRRIWVAPCARFLRYLETVGDLQLDVQRHRGGLRLLLSGRRDPLDEKDLAGVSLRIRGAVAHLEVELAGAGGRRRPCRAFQFNPIGPARVDRLVAGAVPAGVFSDRQGGRMTRQLSAESQRWLADFQKSHGRSPRALHVGNVANNAYLNAKILNAQGFDCDVVCADYYHIMACPEWEDSDFEGDIHDQFYPDWEAVDLGGFERPRWFAQGPMRYCIAYLCAKRDRKRLLAWFWWNYLRTRRWYSCSQRLAGLRGAIRAVAAGPLGRVARKIKRGLVWSGCFRQGGGPTDSPRARFSWRAGTARCRYPWCGGRFALDGRFPSP